MPAASVTRVTSSDCLPCLLNRLAARAPHQHVSHVFRHHLFHRRTQRTPERICSRNPSTSLYSKDIDQVHHVTRRCFGTNVASNSRVNPEHSYADIKGLFDIPGPRGIYSLPFVGFRFLFKPFTKYDIRKLSDVLGYLHREYGPIVKVRLGTMDYLYLFDPDDIEKVFRNDNKFPDRIPMPLAEVYCRRKGRQSGLTSQNGEDWHKLRRPTQTLMMRHNCLTSYLPLLEQVAEEFVTSLESTDRIANLPHSFMRYTAEGVGVLCFGQRMRDFLTDEETDRLLRMVETYLEMFGNHVYQVMPLYLWCRSPYYRRFEAAADCIYGVIADRIQALDSCASSELPHLGLLYATCRRPEMTRNMVERTIFDVYLGGIDSTANALTFLFHELSRNPVQQEKLHAAIMDSMERREGNKEQGTFNVPPYLRACVKESLRLVFPIAGGTLRVLDKDIRLQNYLIPKGTPIQMGNGVICLSEKYFDNPWEFRPERWLSPERSKVIHPFAHLPFGHGARRCVGQRFAEMEIYMLTMKFLSRFRLLQPVPNKDIDYIYCTFVTPRDPVTIHYEKR